MDSLFYVGPIGAMLPLPDVYAHPSAPSSRVGGTHVSLEGVRTVDTFAYKRSWSLAWDTLLPWQIPWVEALQYGMLPGPLRLIDPWRTNRLPEQVASGGSLRRTTRGFDTSTGVLTYRSVHSGVTADSGTLGPGPALRGCMGWQLVTTTGGTMYAYDSQTSDNTWRTPVIPGQQLEVSCWVAGPSTNTAAIGWREYGASGQINTGQGTVTALSSTTWQKLSVTVTPLTATSAITSLLVVPTGNPVAQIFTTGWQIASTTAETGLPGELTAPGCVDTTDLLGGWRPGGGAPVVITAPGDHGYLQPGLHSAGLTFLET